MIMITREEDINDINDMITEEREREWIDGVS